MVAPETEAEVLRAAAEELLKLKDSTGWKILMAQIATDAEQARDEFETVDAGNQVEVERCQRQVARYRYYAETIDILISQGFETEDMEDQEVEDE